MNNNFQVPEQEQEPFVLPPKRKEPITPPGLQLKNARESRGLAQADVARDLKLDPSMIDALESGDPARLPPHVYTAGYIRSYARLMDLSADKMVADLVALERRDVPEIPTPVDQGLPERYRRVAESLPKTLLQVAEMTRIQLTQQQWSSRHVALAFTVILFLASVWLLVSWLGASDSDENVDTALVVKQADESNPMPAPGELGDTGQPQLQDTNTADSTVGSPPVAEAAVAETVPVEPQLTLPGDAPTAQKEDNVQYIEKPLPLPKSAAQLLEDANALALLQQQNFTDLTLTFSRNSWVDIRDSTGKHLIRKMGIAGNSQTVTGVAPFQVLLGFGHGVAIEYNGNQVDFSAFQGDRVARFTLEVPKEKVEEKAPGQ